MRNVPPKLLTATDGHLSSTTALSPEGSKPTSKTMIPWRPRLHRAILSSSMATGFGRTKHGSAALCSRHVRRQRMRICLRLLRLLKEVEVVMKNVWFGLDFLAKHVAARIAIYGAMVKGF